MPDHDHVAQRAFDANLAHRQAQRQREADVFSEALSRFRAQRNNTSAQRAWDAGLAECRRREQSR